MRRFLYLILIPLLLCAGCRQQDVGVADSLNEQSYRIRYTDIRASLSLARQAYRASRHYPDGRAYAINNMAFVCYQQMSFTRGLHILDHVYDLTDNQVELMVADVMRMKISQRTLDWILFYKSWNQAKRREARIVEEIETLTETQKDRFFYATTEMHIIASTFFYYLGQRENSISQIENVSDMMVGARDTSQLLYFHYMLGSGGLINGTPEQVRLKEFDHLIEALAISRRKNNRYIMGNCLQSLAELLCNRENFDWYCQERSSAINYLIVIYQIPQQQPEVFAMSLLDNARQAFREYKDLFQLANVYRTQGDIMFNSRKYPQALASYRTALSLIYKQHDRSQLGVPRWESMIHERLSLAYSALGDHQHSNLHRNYYLDNLETMRQDLDIEAREDEIALYNSHLYRRMGNVAVVSLLIAITFWSLLRRSRKRNISNIEDLQDELQETYDNTNALELRLRTEKLSNIERRAKISLSESIVPLINRLLHQCRNTNDPQYVQELTSEIERLNRFMTDWVTIRKGRLSMEISSFEIQPLLDTLSLNNISYQKAGLTLHIDSTDAVAKGDRVLTLFMLNTLCDNARKFTPQGGSITVSTTYTEEFVQLSVTDTGYGLSQDEVDIINNQKVIDYNQIGQGTNIQDKKGFGFGLMNCKGIIGQMQKMSQRFSVCDFGVNSTVGKGSTFWFRLPRVLTMLVLFFGTVVCNARAGYYDYYDSLYNCNLSSQYDSALYWGQKAIQATPQDSSFIMLNIHNEMAIACLALKKWEQYRYHNQECVRLHSLLTYDPNLTDYAESIRTRIFYSQLATAVAVIMVIIALLVFLYTYHHSVLNRKHEQEILSQLQDAREIHNRKQYEFETLYIHNQVLDNCLSTIKHETMYYPSRIAQMSAQQDCDSDHLTQMCQYYHDIFTLLLAQAERQVRDRIRIDDDITADIKRRVNNIIQEYRDNGRDFPENLFSNETTSYDALVVREYVRLLDAQQGHPGLRLYVQNNEIIITLCKNSKLSLSKTSNWS